MAATADRYVGSCVLSGHERSGRSARLDEASGVYFSNCKHCGVGMRRIAPKQWVVCRGSARGRASGSTHRRAAVWSAAALGAVATGAFLGVAALETISEARTQGLFGGAMVPVEMDPPAASNEDIAAGGATAVALKITTLVGCSRVSAKLRRGCLRHVQSLK